MRALAIQLTPSDIRCFLVDDPAYKVGYYLERDKPGPNPTNAVLAVARVPTGKQAPVGRLTPAQLRALADQGLQEVEPEVIARYPYWAYLVNNGTPVEVVGEAGAKDVQVPVEDGAGGYILCDATIEDIQIYPPSQRDRSGAYVCPPNGYEPLSKPAAPAKAADKPAKDGA